MVRCLLKHMTGPRRLRAIHKAQRYSCMHISGHPLYRVCSLWPSPVPCPQSLVIPCPMSAVSGHLLSYVRSLWSSPVLCPTSLVISCTVSAVSGHLLYCVCSPLVQNIFFLVFLL
ncbi:unnamed protein product [Staurois parvus]|uniref:Uncharacterized protein n=1 Tax=Staurois parvus TaxID=386267 RepID=A0ABN9E0Z6_9NEOB|nr:unnamed protein product [Staurois parvus]